MRLRNNSGIILIVVLWILVVLSMLAIGLGRRTSVEVALTRATIGQLRAKYAALAGLNYALYQIIQDSKDEETRSFDTKYLCGFRLEEDQSPEDLFKQVHVGEGFFDVFYSAPLEGEGTIHYGLEDEESKINLNTLPINKAEIVEQLLLMVGVGDVEAETLSNLLVQEKRSEESGGIFKKRRFGSIEEILNTEGLAPEVFSEIKPFLTIFPEQGRFAVNFDTADRMVLLALARSYAGDETNTTLSDAESLVDKILTHRMGEDGIFASEDDKWVEMTDMDLNQKEQSIFLAMKQHQTRISRYLRASIRGVDGYSQVVSHLQAVINRQDNLVVYWHRY